MHEEIFFGFIMGVLLSILAGMVLGAIVYERPYPPHSYDGQYKLAVEVPNDYCLDTMRFSPPTIPEQKFIAGLCNDENDDMSVELWFSRHV